jgi:iron complex outermembrane receptor protein
MIRQPSLTTIGPMALALAFAFVPNVYAQRTISSEIEEVVVTAQHREENIQDVAISMSALDASAIEKTFSRTIDEITGMSPNLIINPILGNGTVGVSLRGMQTAEVEKSFDPAVAIYQDGVYLASTTGALLNIWDAERVEVLRGPQGTLFGRNTIGGLLHVIRSKPTGEMGGKVVATFAENDQEDFKARINFPEFAGISLKLSAVNSEGGGYIRNPTRGETLGDNDLFMYTIDGLWAPTDNFDLRIIYDDISDDTATRPVTCLTTSNETFGGFTPPNQCAASSDGNDLFTTYTREEQYSELNTEAVTIHANWQINEDHKLAVVYGNREVDERALNEFDGISFDLFRTSRPQQEDQESLEIRIESDWNDTVRSTVGLFLWDGGYTLQQNTAILQDIFGPQSFTASPLYSQEVESTAYFGQVDWDVSDKLSLSFGGRYIEEKKSLCMTVAGYSFDGSDVDYIDEEGFPKTATAQWGKDCPSWAADVYDSSFDGSETWSKFTPRVSAQYELERGMAYITYSEGFRSGGFNGRATSIETTGPYEPESVKQWELGTKLTMLENTLQLNVSVFTIAYDDKQEDIVKPGTDGQATLTIIENASSATINGVEIDFNWYLTEGFSVRGNVGFLDASFDDFLADSATGVVDLSNIELRRAPEMTAGLTALWERQLSNGNFVIANLSYTWKDDYYISATANADHTPGGYIGFNPSKVDSFGIVDASINYETDNWTFSVFGKNLTDEVYLMSFLDVGANNVATSATDSTPAYAPGLWSFGTPNRPRYFGAEVQFKF